MITSEEPAISNISLALFADQLRGFIAQREYESHLAERVAVLHSFGIELSANDLSSQTSLHVSVKNVQ